MLRVTPLFIIIAPPIDPGIQDKYSNPLKEFSLAKSESFLSRVDAPTSNVKSSTKLTKENLELNLIVIPFIPPSLIKVFDPAPITKILLLLGLTFYKVY